MCIEMFLFQIWDFRKAGYKTNLTRALPFLLLQETRLLQVPPIIGVSSKSKWSKTPIFDDWHPPSTQHGLEVGGKALRNAVVSKAYILSCSDLFGKNDATEISNKGHTSGNMRNKESPLKNGDVDDPFCSTSFQSRKILSLGVFISCAACHRKGFFVIHPARKTSFGESSQASAL